MKKALSVLIAILMILALVSITSCSKEEPPPATQPPAAQTAAPAATAAPTAQPTAAPQPTKEEPMFVGVVCPGLDGEWLRNMLTSYCDRVEEWGCETQLVSAEYDNAKYITIMENFLQMGSDLILNVAMDVQSCKDITLKCIDEGCFVIMLGVWPDYEISGGLIADFAETGEAAALMVIDWAEKNIQGAADSIPVAVLTAQNTSDAVKRSNAFLKTIDEGEKTFVDYQENQPASTPEAGFTFAENALTYNSKIRCFLTYEIEPGMGANNYIIQRPEFKVAEFCVVGVGQTQATLALIDQAKADPASSCLRGSLSYGGPDPGIQLNEISKKLLLEGVDPPYWMYDELYTINSWGWELPAYFNE